MKHIYEESLHERDKLVDNLHARLQTQMYDVQGVPWTNIPKQDIEKSRRREVLLLSLKMDM
jgi:hypothetical protein